MITPPPHEPGLLPRWLAEKGANIIIAGGMGKRAQDLFTEQGIKVVTGAPVAAPDQLVTQYLGSSPGNRRQHLRPLKIRSMPVIHANPPSMRRNG